MRFPLPNHPSAGTLTLYTSFKTVEKEHESYILYYVGEAYRALPVDHLQPLPPSVTLLLSLSRVLLFYRNRRLGNTKTENGNKVGGIKRGKNAD